MSDEKHHNYIHFFFLQTSRALVSLSNRLRNNLQAFVFVCRDLFIMHADANVFGYAANEHNFDTRMPLLLPADFYLIT